ncbi:MAG: lytic transglycosylase domain-containing protein [Nitrospirota bacterium]
MHTVRLFIVCLLLLPSISNAFCYEDAGNACGINPSLLKSIARIESGLNPRVINRNLDGSIDMGLMQINSSWVSRLRLDSGRLLQDPCYNVMAGARILRLCIDKHGYTWEAVGCYNAVSRQKRIGYSWKVYKELKAEGRRQKTENRTKKSPELRTNPSFSFTVKDGASIE